jgi:glycosyltransferase involved in cell wall biosynthesis
MLRIFIPALQVAPGLTGVGTYTVELIRAMTRLPRREKICIGAPHPELFEFAEGLDGIEVLPLQIRGEGSVGRMIATHSIVPQAAQQWGADVLFGPNFIAPMWGKFRTAVMVHDLTFWRFPETTTPAKRLYYRLLVGRSIRRASATFVSTRVVGEELIRFEPSVEGRVWRTPEGVSPGYLVNGDREEVSTSRVTARERRDFLFVGTLEPRKNLVRLLMAHGNLCRADAKFPGLRLVGGKGWEDEGILQALDAHPDPSRLHRLGYREPDELKAEYDSALAFVFPSIYEGFGLPVLEAMARGCPVLTSRMIATEEVAGDAAVLVDPSNLGEIERGMARLAADEKLRRNLSKRGPERAREFSWEICAEETLKGLHALCSDASEDSPGGS